ncbi:MAG: cytochrome P450 [Chloroflexota bacterium]|nr:cytochrome P450 [Chloroflexota bacterium]
MTTSHTDRMPLPKATLRETLGVLLVVAVPIGARGVIIRRPRVVAVVEKLDLDRRAVRRVQRLRDKYGAGPLLLRLPVRRQALILAPDHVRRVLAESPEPFATASSEKRAALSHFQPQGVLISHGRERAERRRYNEAVLDAPRPVHRLGERFSAVVDEEAAPLLSEARRRGTLDWDAFAGAWFRVVRRVTLGDAARDDQELTDLINQLRSDANWAFLRRKRTELRERFDARLGEHLARAEPGSLAAVMAETPASAETAPAQQVPQWLFAFDPAGMAAIRALALLAAHPEQAARAREEIAAREGSARLDLPFLRACVLESLRLWPTTPMVLRQTTAATTWETGEMPARTGVAIFAPFFHRDDRRRPEADRFAPDLWLEGRAAEDWSLIPFSGGPASCPGRNLVLLVTSAMLASLLRGTHFHLDPPNRLDPRRPLLGTLNHASLRFRVDRADAAG